MFGRVQQQRASSRLQHCSEFYDGIVLIKAYGPVKHPTRFGARIRKYQCPETSLNYFFLLNKSLKLRRDYHKLPGLYIGVSKVLILLTSAGQKTNRDYGDMNRILKESA